MRSRSSRTIGWVKAGNGVEIEKLRAAERLHAEAAGQLPVVVPLIVAADIAHVAGLHFREHGIDDDPCVLHAGEQSPRFVRVQRVAGLEDRVVGGRGQRRVGNRSRCVALDRQRRKQAAVLLIEVGLKSDRKTVDIERRPGQAARLRRGAADAAIDRQPLVDVNRQRECRCLMLRLAGEDKVPSDVRLDSVANSGGALNPIESAPAGSVV